MSVVITNLIYEAPTAARREGLGFLFRNSYETKGSIAPDDENKIEKIFQKYLLDPARARRGLRRHVRVIG